MVKTKAIFIAAGMGRRLHPYTDECPKCMLPLGGMPVIAHNIKLLNDAGVKDVSIVTGYQKDKVVVDSARYFVNDDYTNNNILFSLMFAKDVFKEVIAEGAELIISYSDIIYSEAVLSSLLRTPGEIVLSVDPDYKILYDGRTEHPVSEAEKALITDRLNVTKLGKGMPDEPGLVSTEFIGLLRLSKHGAMKWLDRFQDLQLTRDHLAPFQRAAELRKSYLTDFLQHLIDDGELITASVVSGGWMEFDTPQDYERLLTRYQ